MEERGLPLEIRELIGSEEREFEVKAAYSQSRKTSWTFIIFGAVWSAFSMIFVIVFLGPLFLGQEVHFESNGVPTTASPDNLGPIIMPAVIIGIFELIGIVLIAWGLASMFVKGGYFIGTPTRLIIFSQGKMRSIDWEQFTGDIEVSGNENKGTIALRLRSGKVFSRKNGPEQFVPETIVMNGIPNVYHVEKICRERIKQNDPTPPIMNVLK
ncbi:MAG: hypothetical protein ACM3PT_02225 [Deltaproteobacteria bacterium]